VLHIINIILLHTAICQAAFRHALQKKHEVAHKTSEAINSVQDNFKISMVYCMVFICLYMDFDFMQEETVVCFVCVSRSC
jgi:hypothetical protein